MWIDEAQTSLSTLVELAAAGKEIVIAEAGKPIARIVGDVRSTPPRTPGQLKGKISIKRGFDDLPPDFPSY